MKKIVFALAVLAALITMGCTTTTLPVKITGQPVGSKVGEATATYVFHSLPTGDNSYQAAAAAGGVSVIATVEQRVSQNLFMTKVTTIVTGE